MLSLQYMHRKVMKAMLPSLPKHSMRPADRTNWKLRSQYLSILSIVDNTDQVLQGVADIKKMALMFNNKMVNNYLVSMLQPIAKNKEEKAALATPDKKTALLKQSEFMKKVASELKN